MGRTVILILSWIIRLVTETTRLLADGLFGRLSCRTGLSNAYLKTAVRTRKLSIPTQWSSCLWREKRTGSILASSTASEQEIGLKQDRT